MKAVWQSARTADALIGIIDISANPKDALDTIQQIFQSKDAKSLPFALVFLPSAYSIMHEESGDESVVLLRGSSWLAVRICLLKFW